MARRALLLAAAVLAIGTLACSDDDAAGPTPSSSSTRPTTEPTTTTTEPDYTASTSPDCTVGTIPEGRPVPPGCDRLYSPFLGPGQDCVAGQAPDCVDLDRDGLFSAVIGAGSCLVERKSYDRCQDADDDGFVDDPVG